MKNIQKIMFAFFVLAVSSCLRPPVEETETPFDGSMQRIENIAGSEILEKVQLMGFHIHAGSNPPLVEGTFMADPLEVLSSTWMDEWPGIPVEAQLFRLYNQDNNNQKLKYESEEESQTGEISTAWISGRAGSFSIFYSITDDSEGYLIEILHIISGVIGPSGIHQFQKAVFVKTIGDGAPDEIWNMEGKGRVVHEIDQLAERQL